MKIPKGKPNTFSSLYDPIKGYEYDSWNPNIKYSLRFRDKEEWHYMENQVVVDFFFVNRPRKTHMATACYEHDWEKVLKILTDKKYALLYLKQGYLKIFCETMLGETDESNV